MAQNFRSAHGFGYEDYKMDPLLRLKVEERREREYARSLEFGNRPELRNRH